MRKRIFLLVVISCFATNIFAQDKYVDSLVDWVNKHPKIDSQYIQTLHRISYRLSEKDVNRSFYYYGKVSALSDSLHFTFGKSLAQINLGILLYNSGNFDASNDAFFKAIDYAEACGALRLKAVSLNNAGDNFKTLRNFEKCRQYTKEAIDINTQLKAWRGVAINYELLNECDLNEKLYKDAKRNLIKGMPFALLANESYILSQFYVGFGKLHAIDNHIDSALFYFRKAMDQAMLQRDVRNEYQVYLAEAQYLKNLTPDRKIILLDSALSIATRTQYFEGISNAAEQLSLAYDEKKDKDSSLIFYRVYRTAFDIIFTTAYNHYSIDAIRISAFDYLVKPIGIEDLQHAVERLHKTRNKQTKEKVDILKRSLSDNRSQEDKIAISTSEGIEFVPIKNILHIESKSNYSKIYLPENKTILVTKILKDFEEMLLPYNFYRVHNSHLINLNYIKKYIRSEGGHVMLQDGTVIDISRRKKEEFLKMIGG